MPSRTTSSASSATPAANSISSATRSRMRRGSSSQPSQCASSCPVQTVGSRSQMRSTSSFGANSGGDKLAALGANPVEQLCEGVGELLHALLLEHARDVVDVDAGLGELVEQKPCAVEIPLERQRDLAVVLEGRD